MSIPTKAAPTLIDVSQDPQSQPQPRLRPRKTLCGRAYHAVLVLTVSWIAYKAVQFVVRTIQHPHGHLYQDLNQPYSAQDVVRPLIDSNQTFDLFATAWLRTNTVEGHDDMTLEERPIFTRNVFQNMTLQDKLQKTSVQLRVPTHIFKQKVLNNYDLRASFVLVPNSPSPLDHVSGYSSWITPEARHPPVRSWPGQQNVLSLKDEVVDSYGTFTPLLSFQNIQSRCRKSTRDDYDAIQEGASQKNDIPIDIANHRGRWTSTRGKPTLAYHPYIITKSVIHVVNSTRVLKKLNYDRMHDVLKNTSCGRKVVTNGVHNKPRWQDCSRTFATNGNQEVRIELTRNSDENAVEGQKGWVYAPYISATESSWTPLDLMPVPVNRESCLETETSQVPDAEFIDVTWNIEFEASSPSYMLFVDKPPSANHEDNHYDMTKPRATIADSQSAFEATKGNLAGDQLDDSDPSWRALFLELILTILMFFSLILQVVYWFTRTSTIGISTSGNGLIVAARLFSFAINIAQVLNPSGIAAIISLIPFALFTQIHPLLMFKALLGVRIYRYRGLIPWIRIIPPTHAERASRRLDLQTSWAVKTGLFLVLAGIFSSSYYFNTYIIYPMPGGHEKLKSNPVLALQSFTTSPMIILGWLLQILLNARTKTFEGMYAISAYFGAAILLIKLVYGLLGLCGEPPRRDGLTYFDFAEGLCDVAFAFQVFTYPRISLPNRDEDS